MRGETHIIRPIEGNKMSYPMEIFLLTIALGVFSLTFTLAKIRTRLDRVIDYLEKKIKGAGQ